MTSIEIARLVTLLKRLKDGDMEVFDEFYETTKRPLYYSLLGLVKNEDLAEELLEETFIKFLHNLPKVKNGRNPLGYLLVSGRNLALDYFKKENRVSSIDDYTNELEIGASVEEKFDDSDRLLEKMQKLLSEDEYQIVVLYVLSEFSHKEIAEHLKKPLGSVTWSSKKDKEPGNLN